jgi:molecular chaperone DnaK
LATIDSAVEEMNKAWTAASEEIYKASQGSAQGGPQGGPTEENGHAGANAAQGDQVTDAEYEEVK